MSIEIAIENEVTALVVIPDGTALQVFTTEGAMEPFLARVRKEIDAFVPDTSTAKGRKAIASMAHIVTKTKTYLDSAGKELNDVQKEIPKKIDAARKAMRDTLDGWKDEVRKPLTDWENAEEARIKKHTDMLTWLNETARSAPGLPASSLLAADTLIRDIAVGPECEEFEEDYKRAVTSTREIVSAELAKAIQREKDIAELEALRADKAKRDEETRQQKIRDDAAAEATRIAKEESEKLLEAERNKTKLAEQAALAATQAAEAAAQKALDDAAAAKALEEATARQAADDQARRERNKAHIRKINVAAVEAFVAGGMTEKSAKEAVTLIAMKKIPAITITY